MEKRAVEQASFDWDDLRVFLAVFRAGSINAAARTLGIDQSTVSRRLRTLEDQLGAPLFTRLPEGTHPTEAAARILPAAERAEAAAGAVGQAIAGFEVAVEGVVRIASIDSMIRAFLIPRLAPLLERHPRLRLELVGGHALADLTRHEADLALRLLRPRRGDLIVRKLASLSLGVFASPSYAARVGRPRALSELDWVGWESALQHLPEAQWLHSQVKTAPRVAGDNYGVLMEAAQAGLGAILTGALSARHAGLVPVPVSRSILPRRGPTLWLVGHRALRDVPRVEAVWDFICAHAAEL